MHLWMQMLQSPDAASGPLALEHGEQSRSSESGPKVPMQDILEAKLGKARSSEKVMWHGKGAMVANCRWFTQGHQHPQQSQPHHPYPSPGKGRALTVLWKFMLSTSAWLHHYLSSLKQRGRLFHTIYVSRNGAFNWSLSEYFIQYQMLIFLQMIVKFLHHCRSKNAK